MPTGPASILFACTLNAVRSPMAEAITKAYYGNRIYVDSVGVRAGELDGFAVAAMDEIGIDLAGHKPKTFDQLEDSFYDVILSLSPEAQHRAVELTRTMACELEFWNTFDPTIVNGSREVILDAYRGVRDGLVARIHAYFGAAPGPVV